MHPVLIRPRHVDEALCNQIVSSCDTAPRQPRSYQGLVDPSLRQCDYVPLSKRFHPIFEQFAAGPMSASFGAPVDPRLVPVPLIYRYYPGVGFCLHHDEVTATERRNAAETGQPVVGGDFTIVLFLSSPSTYGGGALVFPDFDLRLRPERGTFVAFPATRAYMHLVEPISHGLRYTVVGRTYWRSNAAGLATFNRSRVGRQTPGEPGARSARARGGDSLR